MFHRPPLRDYILASNMPTIVRLSNIKKISGLQKNHFVGFFKNVSKTKHNCATGGNISNYPHL